MIQRIFYQVERRVPSGVKGIVPESVRTWVGYQVKVRRDGAQGRMAALHKPLVLPEGESRESILAYLEQFWIETEGRSEELDTYLREALDRFLLTLGIVPDGAGRLLEVGANPYFISLLLDKFRDYTCAYTNFFGEDYAGREQVLVNEEGVSKRFPFDNVNVETERLKHEDGVFDVVLLCEVLEHFTNDPVAALREIRRVLKMGGHLILTTPNVARLENVARMINGENIYDPYSFYGAYGRHNREYTERELRDLLGWLGFEIEVYFTSDVQGNLASLSAPLGGYWGLIKHRFEGMGQYHFVRARVVGEAREGRPEWLYRAYPSEAEN